MIQRALLEGNRAFLLFAGTFRQYKIPVRQMPYRDFLALDRNYLRRYFIDTTWIMSPLASAATVKVTVLPTFSKTTFSAFATDTL